MSVFETDKELQELLTACFDGTLNEGQKSALNARIKTDTQARALYLDMCNIHTALAWEHGMLVATTPVELTHKDRLSNNARRLSFVPWQAISKIAAILVVAIILGVLAIPKNDGVIVANISNHINAELYSNDQLWTEPNLKNTTYELRSGLIELSYDNGVSVVIQCPAEFRLSSNSQLDLIKGRLSSHVPPSAIGFVVMTPQAEVVDLGTEFGVDVNEDGQSEVHVFHGLVTVRGSDAPVEQRQEVHTDQAVRVSNTTSPPAGIDVDAERFFRTLRETGDKYVRKIKSFKPISFYRMGMSEDNSLRDVMGNNPGMVLIRSGRHMPWAPGMFGASLYVGGRSVGRGMSFSNEPINEYGKFTVVAFVRAEAWVPNAIIMSEQSADKHLQIGLDESGDHIAVTIIDNDGSQKSRIQCLAPQKTNLNSWYHITVIGDGNTIRLYINGDMVSEQRCPSLAMTKKPTWLVGTSGNDKHLFEGRIDELAVFHHVLSDDIIRELAAYVHARD